MFVVLICGCLARYVGDYCRIVDDIAAEYVRQHSLSRCYYPMRPFAFIDNAFIPVTILLCGVPSLHAFTAPSTVLVSGRYRIK